MLRTMMTTKWKMTKPLPPALRKSKMIYSCKDNSCIVNKDFCTSIPESLNLFHYKLKYKRGSLVIFHMFNAFFNYTHSTRATRHEAAQ